MNRTDSAPLPRTARNIAQAWQHIEQKQYAKAAALLEGDPAPEARHVLGYAYVGLGRFEAARALYRPLLQEAGVQAEAHRHLHQLGMVEREAGNSSAALEHFEEEGEWLGRTDAGALERAVNSYELAVNLYALGKTREAHAALAEAFAQAREAGDLTALGRLWRAAGDFARAEGLAGSARDAYANARDAFAAAGDQPGAAEIEQRLADINQRSPAASL